MSDFVITIDNEKYSINTNHSTKVLLNGVEHDLEILQLSDHTYKILLNNKVYHITANKLQNNLFSFLIDGHYFESFVRTRLEEKAANLLNSKSEEKGENTIKSPMPGLILRIDKNIGDRVNKGDSLVLLEAMKMENEIRSPSTGIISKILITEGNSVEKGQSLLIVS